MAFDLNFHIARLLHDEPFFAALSRHINKMASESVPTAGVKIDENSGYYEMLYNPEFFSKLTDAEIKIVLKHEFLHLVFEHVSERLPSEGMSLIWNQATDAAINSELFPSENCFADDNLDSHAKEVKNLYDMAVLPEKFGAPRGKTAEWYFDVLKQKQEEEEKQGGGSGDSDMPGGFDNHEGWGQEGEIPQEVREIAKQRIKEAMQDAAQEATARGWGSVSSSLRKEIVERLKSKIDWKKVLRYFIKTSQKANKSSSIKRINRRYPYIHAGRKTARTSKIAISIDQSGSVSDRMLAAFYAELNKLSDLAEFTVVPFDTRVEESKVFVWKKGEKRKFERVLTGGTCFNAPTNWVNEREFDGHIVLTDMYAPKPVASRAQRMWVTDSESFRNPYFTTNERVIAVEY